MVPSGDSEFRRRRVDLVVEMCRLLAGLRQWGPIGLAWCEVAIDALITGNAAGLRDSATILEFEGHGRHGNSSMRERFAPFRRVCIEAAEVLERQQAGRVG